MENYTTKKHVVYYLLAALCLVGLTYASLFWGTISINPLGQMTEVEKTIFFSLRLPRTLQAIAAGIGLSLCGAVLQTLLRNSLADPYIIGTSSGAALGSIIALLAGVGRFYHHWPFAFLFALGALGVVYRLALIHGKIHGENLLLSGVIVNTFCSGLITLLLFLHRKELYEIMFWIMGNLGQASLLSSIIVLAATLVVSVILILTAEPLNIFTLGDEKAVTLGISVEKMKKGLLILVSLQTALIVSFCGTIGFVGLIVPHFTRRLIGPHHKNLLCLSAIIGASFLLLSDIIARTVVSPMELPIGVITALCGAPYFLYIFYRKKILSFIE